MKLSKSVILSILAILIVLGAILAINRLGANIASSEDVRIIRVNATSFSYEPENITVKQGEHVKIIINNVDKNHGISIPELNVSGLGEVDFVANQKGTFEFHCPTFCGSGHREMTGTLIVE